MVNIYGLGTMPTVFSQLVDTSVVLMLLCYFSVIEWNMFFQLLLNGFLFKVLFAALDTPLSTSFYIMLVNILI